MAVLLTVVCTDRGQHKRRRIALMNDDGVQPLKVPDLNGNWHRGGGLRLYCRTCRRNVELSWDSWQRLLAVLHGAGMDTFDMSHIPGV